MELTDVERIAIATAMEKQLKLITNPRDANSVRAHVDEQLMQAYKEVGTDRVRVRIGGVEVGTISVTTTKESTEQIIAIDSISELIDWVRDTDEGRDALSLVIGDVKVQDALLKAAKAYGFLPDGCHVQEVYTPERVKGTVVRIKPEKVYEALQDKLPQAVAGMLED